MTHFIVLTGVPGLADNAVGCASEIGQHLVVPVRRLVPEDAELLRSVRLRALADAPDAFGSTLERELAFSDETWRSRLEPTANPHFVEERDDGAVLGLVAGVRADGDVSVVYLVAMWVAPTARGTGVADRLVQRVIAWASEQAVKVVRLHVMQSNGRAERVYERNGFRRTGQTVVRDRDGLVEVEMERLLT